MTLLRAYRTANKFSTAVSSPKSSRGEWTWFFRLIPTEPLPSIVNTRSSSQWSS
jgi:hypothetical protein